MENMFLPCMRPTHFYSILIPGTAQIPSALPGMTSDA